MFVRVFKMSSVASQVAGSVLQLESSSKGPLRSKDPTLKMEQLPWVEAVKPSATCNNHLQRTSASPSAPRGVHITERVGGEMWTVQVVWGKREEKYGKMTLLWLYGTLWVFFEKKLQEGEPDTLALPEAGKLRWRVQLLPCWQVPFIYGFIIFLYSKWIWTVDINFLHRNWGFLLLSFNFRFILGDAANV